MYSSVPVSSPVSCRYTSQVPRVVRLEQSIAGFPRDFHFVRCAANALTGSVVVPEVPVPNERPADEAQVLRDAVGVAKVFRGFHSFICVPRVMANVIAMCTRGKMRGTRALRYIFSGTALIQHSGSPLN